MVSCNNGIRARVGLLKDFSRAEKEELLMPYLRSRSPRRRELVDVVWIFDAFEAKRGMAITGEGDGEPSLEWCTVIGHLAKYMIRTGKARQISKEEFLEILKKSEDRGFVHNVANANGKDEIEYVAALSVPEGRDKPLKYPLMFEVCHVLLINKIDVIQHFDFDMDKVIQYARMRNPALEIFPVSAKTGEWFGAWEKWLHRQVHVWKKQSE